MNDDPDLPIRLAAFRAVATWTDRYGDSVPWEVIQRGFDYKGRTIALATKARGIFRPKEMQGGALSVKTVVPRQGRQGRYTDLVDTSRGTMDYSFQGDDPDSRDNLLLEWCRRAEAPLVYLYAVDVGVYALIWPVIVASMDREHLRARLVQEDLRAVPPEGAMVLRDPTLTAINRRYLTIQARARLHQAAFRGQVLRAYDQRCAVCGLPRLDRMVEAAHIVPDHDEQGYPDVQNGLALCVLHHRAFDAHLIGVSPDAVLALSPRLVRAQDGPLLEVGLRQYGGQRLRLPTREEERPGQEFLEHRWETFQLAAASAA